MAGGDTGGGGEVSMNESTRQTQHQPGVTIGCHAFLEPRLSEIGELRDQPGLDLPPRFLRHADEHTVVGVHAVLAARATHPAMPPVAGHAVVAAPCQAGRIAGGKTLAQMAVGGGVTVSPHIVPQCSLHSIAGAVSVALGMHGPHLGVGGGPEALGEGLLVAASLLLSSGDPNCNGVWLIATEWDEEPPLDHAGTPLTNPRCRGLAVFLEPLSSPEDGGTMLQPLAFELRMKRSVRGPQFQEPAGGLVAFARALDMCREGAALASWAVACPGGGEIRVRSRSRSVACGLREAA